MSVRLRLDGLDELRSALRRLPSDLALKAGAIVDRAASDAAQDIRAGYQAHRRTGNLAEHVKVDHQASGVGVKAVVKSTAKHAFIFENGTQARHTDIGANRGSMPPGHVFIPAAIRSRRKMNDQLIQLVRDSGLVVTGHV